MRRQDTLADSPGGLRGAIRALSTTAGGAVRASADVLARCAGPPWSSEGGRAVRDAATRLLLVAVVLSLTLSSVAAGVPGGPGAAAGAAAMPAEDARHGAPVQDSTVDPGTADEASVPAVGTTNASDADADATNASDADADATNESAEGNADSSSQRSDLTTTQSGRDTGVVWRGFRHAWSYNHRLNRLGSWVEMGKCVGDICRYEVGHSGASGSGKDRAAVRDAYTELSATGVGFDAGNATLSIEGMEKLPDNGGGQDEVIRVEEDVEVDLSPTWQKYDRYAAVLNGFDVQSEGTSAKVVDFNLGVSEVSTDRDTATFTITATVLFDCDSVECEGPGTKRGGKGKQEVDYELDVQYLLVGGHDDTLQVTRADEMANHYSWDRCKNNKVENPFTDEEEDDDWKGNNFPGNHMHCERSEGWELDYRNMVKRDTGWGDTGGDYSVGTVGISELDVDLEAEAHFSQFDMVVGGSYDATGGYDVKALPFFKEWTSRHGLYSSAKFAYGHKGSGSAHVEPVLVQIADGCKRSFVTAGGLEWMGGDRQPDHPDATVTREYAFEYGDQWRGERGYGSACTYDESPTVPYDAVSGDPAFWVTDYGGKSVWREFQSTEAAEDPTKLRGEASDRYYSREQTDRPTDEAELGNVELVKTKDVDGDGKVSELWFRVYADLNYDDPVAGESGSGDPALELSLSPAGSNGFIPAFELTSLQRRDSTDSGFVVVVEIGRDVPALHGNRYAQVRATVTEQSSGANPELATLTRRLPYPRRVETPSDDEKEKIVVDSDPGGFVYVDGEYVGQTPWEGQVPENVDSSETHTVEVRRAGWQNASTKTSLEPPQTIEFDLEKKTAPVVVTSDPEGAAVYVKRDFTYPGWEYEGRTPVSVDVWQKGPVDVKLVKESYVNRTYTDVTPPRAINASLLATGALEDVGNYSLVFNPILTNLTFEGTPNGTSYSNESDSVVTPVGGFDETVVGVGGDESLYLDSLLTELPQLEGIVVANYTTAPRQPVVYRPVTFDARASFSLSSGIDSYRWTFGDGTTASGPVVDHTYNDSGTYTVELTVVDDGTTTTTTRRVTVESLPPSAAMSVVSGSVESGEAATFDASRSVDPDGSVAAVRWDMGDGTRLTGERVTHTYASSGTYTVTVTVVDGDGETDTVRRTVTVAAANDPPTPAFSLGAQRVAVGGTLSLDASASSDPDGRVASYSWHLGDGVVATGETVEHAYAAPGTYNVTLVVVDDDGERRSIAKSVVVRNGSSTADGDDESDPDSATATPTTRATATGDSSDSADRPELDEWVETPGFGVAAALLALLAVGSLLRRRS